MNEALKPGALVFHAEYGVAFVRRGNAHGARFVWWVEGPGFEREDVCPVCDGDTVVPVQSETP